MDRAVVLVVGPVEWKKIAETANPHRVDCRYYSLPDASELDLQPFHVIVLGCPEEKDVPEREKLLQQLRMRLEREEAGKKIRLLLWRSGSRADLREVANRLGARSWSDFHLSSEEYLNSLWLEAIPDDEASLREFGKEAERDAKKQCEPFLRLVAEMIDTWKKPEEDKSQIATPLHQQLQALKARMEEQEDEKTAGQATLPLWLDMAWDTLALVQDRHDLVAAVPQPEENCLVCGSERFLLALLLFLFNKVFARLGMVGQMLSPPLVKRGPRKGTVSISFPLTKDEALDCRLPGVDAKTGEECCKDLLATLQKNSACLEARDEKTVTLVLTKVAGESQVARRGSGSGS